jgi:hypothetical protein
MIEALRRQRAKLHLARDERMLPERLRELPTMLTPRERGLLYSLGRTAPPETQIVDAGCFLGGSTVPLALGASERLQEPCRLVHSYDLFRVDYAARMHHPGLVGRLEDGHDLRPLFEEIVGDQLMRYVEVHAGDLMDQHWSGEPVGVLFVDVAKNWGLADQIVHQFFPALVPGRSVVVQQDYIHEWLPWIHITMQLLERCFERAAVVPRSPSVVFRCTRAVATADLPHHLRDIPDGRLEQLFDQAIAPYRGEQRSILDCARAVLLADLHGADRAVAYLDELAARVRAPSKRFEIAWGDVRSWAASLPS